MQIDDAIQKIKVNGSAINAQLTPGLAQAIRYAVEELERLRAAAVGANVGAEMTTICDQVPADCSGVWCPCREKAARLLGNVTWLNVGADVGAGNASIQQKHSTSEN